jgi:hypothetical protein
MYSSITFLCQEIISSLRIARKMLSTLNLGSTKHLAAATIDEVNTPPIPTGDISSLMFGVNRNGTGRFASSSPIKQYGKIMKKR